MNSKLQQEALRLIELIYAATHDVRLWSVFLNELAKIIGEKSDLRCLTGHYLAPENKILKCAECCQAACQHAPLLSAELNLLKLLAPHVIRAVQIRQQVDAANDDKALLQGLLNCWSIGVIIVDCTGKNLSMNLPAQ